jgi:plastocyanin
MSSPHSHDEEGKGYSPHMRGVALGILVMGVSLAAIIILWATFGYKGSAFSTEVMERQQAWLHEQYGLPPLQELSPEMLEVPPSLRGVTAATNATNQTGGGANATTTGGGANATNQTGGGANATTTTGGGANATTTGGGANATTTTGGGANATNQTGGGAGNTTGTGTTGGEGGGNSVSIVPGSASLTDTAFQPNPVQVSVGSTVTWTNNDAQPHTATSGQNATPDGTFDSEIMAPQATFEHTFTEAGEFPYFCLLHPNMVGTVSVSS